MSLKDVWFYYILRASFASITERDREELQMVYSCSIFQKPMPFYLVLLQRQTPITHTHIPFVPEGLLIHPLYLSTEEMSSCCCCCFLVSPTIEESKDRYRLLLVISSGFQPLATTSDMCR